ncbi:glycogen synthase GlgA [candidate division GN15 bacterium]|uniref:Glycogen synthase n=1 Tax=candidate division GN15 bacterium TaxID=2072418 RepID=A0A855XCT0_9BACT|nr:MAG: glycogen synthase GlgA [candidate division GN15 bacterium]
MDKLRILEAASEVAPFARTGGLGDVLGSLPKALAKLGHDVKVAMPRYGSIDPESFNLTPANIEFAVEVAAKPHRCRVLHRRDQKAKVDYYFLENDEYFGRDEFYLDPKTGKDFADNDERFVFFGRAVLELAKRLNWSPDIVHAHDWQAAVIPAYLRTFYAGEPAFANARSVLTIHNLGYQGLFPGKRFSILGLPDKMFYAVTGPYEFFGKVNFLKGGIATADWITTVSGRYAQEIQSDPDFGCGLEGVLKERSGRLTGILNGVDYLTWSPSRDKEIPYRFAMANLSGKRQNKIELLRWAGLPVRTSSPLIGMVSRLTDQKGWDLVAEAADDLFAMNLQMIVLGNGEAKYQQLLQKLEKKFPDKVRAYFTFDDGLAHRIEAAADMFLMPSRWEPCGLNQMYSLKYGTVPIVREVGGLADTIVPYGADGDKGNGFVFKEYTAEAMLDAVKDAVKLFAGRRTWTKLMKAGMKADFSWDASARQYVDLFRRLTAR